MKRINNKGFTLIELLAVVVVLLIISTIAISSINSAIERNKAKQNASKKEVIVSYAKLYYEQHKNNFTGSCINLSDLSLSENEAKDADGNWFEGKVKVIGSGINAKFEYVDSCP